MLIVCNFRTLFIENIFIPMQVVEMAAANPNGLGREYSCGVSNCGVVTLPCFAGSDGGMDRDEKGDQGQSYKMPMNDEGNCTATKPSLRLVPRGVYYGTSHARNGVVCQLSCQTTNGIFCGCLQYPYPVLTKYEASLCKQKIVNFIDAI